jgi:hypothetical protein
MLFVCTWLWGDKWPAKYVQRLFDAVDRNLVQDHYTVLITNQDIIEGDIIAPIDKRDWHLLNRPGCLVRMRMFDRRLQKHIGARVGDRIVNIDVDAVICGALDPLFDRDDEFTIMQGFNTTNPCPFNGSLWMLRAGERFDVWDDFSWEAVQRIPRHAIPDDQGWLHSKFPNAEAYTPKDGVYAFKKNTWPEGGLSRKLPDNARVVAFPGRDPAKYAELDWIRRHWLDAA